VAPLQPMETVAALFESTVEISLVRKIADGGMGSLYEAVLHGPKGFRKTVALKTIVEEYSSNDKFVDLFVGEAKLVADLVHQNICQVYQLGKVGPRYFIAMEYIGGVNLRQFMDRHSFKARPLPPELATFIISRVCRGLEYAHGKRDRRGQLLGVVHRDISPGNIMISLEGEVKLTDFGVAKARKLMEEVEEGEVRVGKFQYMSPEQARFEPTDARSDLFSIGAVMFELLTGEKLFAAGHDRATLRNVLEKEIPRPRGLNPGISEGVEQIMLRALERDLERRYQTAGEMGYDLEYQIYHQGYGPTIVTLEKHLRGLFPELYHRARDRRATEPMPGGDSTVYERSLSPSVEAEASIPTVIAKKKR